MTAERAPSSPINRSVPPAARQDIDLIWGATLTRAVSLVTRRFGSNFLSVGRVHGAVAAEAGWPVDLDACRPADQASGLAVGAAFGQERAGVTPLAVVHHPVSAARSGAVFATGVGHAIRVRRAVVTLFVARIQLAVAVNVESMPVAARRLRAVRLALAIVSILGA